MSLDLLEVTERGGGILGPEPGAPDFFQESSMSENVCWGRPDLPYTPE